MLFDIFWGSHQVRDPGVLCQWGVQVRSRAPSNKILMVRWKVRVALLRLKDAYFRDSETVLSSYEVVIFMPN